MGRVRRDIRVPLSSSCWKLQFHPSRGPRRGLIDTLKSFKCNGDKEVKEDVLMSYLLLSTVHNSIIRSNNIIIIDRT